MNKSRRDIVSDIMLFLVRPLVYLWMRYDMKTTVIKSDEVDFKRKDPFILLANHTFMFDVVHVPLRFKITPVIVASQDLFTSQPLKFILTYIAKCIPKSKGKSDVRTAKNLFKSIRKGYPILIFPEGDSTFYGETGHIEYSTAKLIKKMNVDVITCKVNGGYLSNPRWAVSKRKNRHIELNYELPLKKDDIKKMSVDEIYEYIKKSLYVNAFEYQEEHMISHKGDNNAAGLENIIYCCPECESIHTIKTNGNEIKCTNCSTNGYLDEFGFIHGFKFDNTIEWDKFQRNFATKLRQQTFSATGEMFFSDYINGNRSKVGQILISYKDNEFSISGDWNDVIPVNEIKNPIVTMRRNFSFTYNDKEYFFKLDNHSSSFLRVTQDKY